MNYLRISKQIYITFLPLHLLAYIQLLDHVGSNNMQQFERENFL